MREDWTNNILLALFCLGCRHPMSPDGEAIRDQFLLDNHLRYDYSVTNVLPEILEQINCIDSGRLNKRIVLAPQFHSTDTGQILLIPYSPNGRSFASSAYSDIASRVILINPGYIRQFGRENTLNDTTSYQPLLVLMLLHEIGHFIIRKQGYFDRISAYPKGKLGQQSDDTQPEFLTSVKRIELTADSLAIDMVRQKLKTGVLACGGVPFNVQLIVPGMQFQLAGTRYIKNFGRPNIDFLHDTSVDHPNLELRVTFMNYFLNPNDSLRELIDNYLYERTVAPVHRQELDPRIFQGQEKKLPPP